VVVSLLMTAVADEGGNAGAIQQPTTGAINRKRKRLSQRVGFTFLVEELVASIRILKLATADLVAEISAGDQSTRANDPVTSRDHD
jgi:hypothetical protein